MNPDPTHLFFKDNFKAGIAPETKAGLDCMEGVQRGYEGGHQSVIIITTITNTTTITTTIIIIIIIVKKNLTKLIMMKVARAFARMGRRVEDEQHSWRLGARVART